MRVWIIESNTSGSWRPVDGGCHTYEKSARRACDELNTNRVSNPSGEERYRFAEYGRIEPDSGQDRTS